MDTQDNQTFFLIPHKLTIRQRINRFVFRIKSKFITPEPFPFIFEIENMTDFVARPSLFDTSNDPSYHAGCKIKYSPFTIPYHIFLKTLAFDSFDLEKIIIRPDALESVNPVLRIKDKKIRSKIKNSLKEGAFLPEFEVNPKKRTKVDHNFRVDFELQPKSKIKVFVYPKPEKKVDHFYKKRKWFWQKKQPIQWVENEFPYVLEIENTDAVDHNCVLFNAVFNEDTENFGNHEKVKVKRTGSVNYNSLLKSIIASKFRVGRIHLSCSNENQIYQTWFALKNQDRNGRSLETPYKIDLQHDQFNRDQADIKMQRVIDAFFSMEFEILAATKLTMSFYSLSPTRQ